MITLASGESVSPIPNERIEEKRREEKRRENLEEIDSYFVEEGTEIVSKKVL